jgi:hypothetical protein
MKNLAKEILRWVVIVACGGCGIWLLIEAAHACISMRWSGDWFDLFALTTLLLLAIAAAAPLSVAYVCYRCQYRKLFLVLGVVGAVLVFGECMSLPDQLGISQFMVRQTRENSAFAFLGLPLCLLFLFGPMYAAAWFYRVCHRLAYPGTGRRQKTRATGWLVWLGVGVMLVPIGASSLIMLTSAMAAASNPSHVAKATSFHWLFSVAGLSILVGSLLCFLGLARRRPILEAEERASDSCQERCREA